MPDLALPAHADLLARLDAVARSGPGDLAEQAAAALRDAQTTAATHTNTIRQLEAKLSIKGESAEIARLTAERDALRRTIEDGEVCVRCGRHLGLDDVVDAARLRVERDQLGETLNEAGRARSQAELRASQAEARSAALEVAARDVPILVGEMARVFDRVEGVDVNDLEVRFDDLRTVADRLRPLVFPQDGQGA